MEIQNKNSRISLQYDFMAPPKMFVWFHSSSVICTVFYMYSKIISIPTNTAQKRINAWVMYISWVMVLGVGKWLSLHIHIFDKMVVQVNINCKLEKF